MQIYYCKKYGVQSHLDHIQCKKRFYKEHMYGKAYFEMCIRDRHYTFCDKGVSDGVSLNVVRDKAGNIEKLVSVDKGELEQFVK